jgi:pimeloyl-ACP methyl ester carboxylesterase
MQVSSGNISLHLTVEGKGDPILFLHGFPDYGDCWRNVMRYFPDAELAALDARGHGRSDCPQDPADYAMSKLVADVLAAADRLNGRPLTLVGHDWGGVVAWYVAAWHPERVRRLVIVNAPHPTLFAACLRHHPAQASASSYVERLIAADDSGLLTPERLWGVTLRNDEMNEFISSAERDELLSLWGQPGRIRAMVNWYRAAPHKAGATGSLPLTPIQIPTLVIWGEEDDLLLPVLLDGLEEEVRDLTICRVAGAGHGIVRQQPGTVASLVRQFMELQPSG